MYFEVDGACCSRFDPLGAPGDEAAEARGAARDREVRLGVFENLGFVACLPGGNLLLKTQPHRLGVERAAIEKDRIHRWPSAEKIGKIACDCTVRRVRESPFS